jgi:hypothetical protein
MFCANCSAYGAINGKRDGARIREKNGEQRMSTFIGIDPGKTGGIAALGDDGHVIDTMLMPAGDEWIHVESLRTSLNIYKSDAVFHPITIALERPLAMPGQSVKSTASQWTTFGLIYATCLSMGVKVCLVRPQEWQKELFREVDTKKKPNGKRDTKAMSAVVCLRLFPQANLRENRNHKPHDGVCDALLIAEYARRKL